jgi:two-component system, NtrC family, response regulator PilR
VNESIPLVYPVKQSRFGTLKKVSGKLRQMWLGKDEKSAELPMPRLLVVDDEESICFSMSEYFSLQGYKVDTACEVEEAEKLLGSTNYKVVIQDLRLTMTNNHDGLDMIRLIREHNPQARIVVLTAYGSAEIEDEARRCGADAFLRKPKPLSQVAQVVQGLLESPSRTARHA